jgi:hypothetical protein
MLSGLNGQSYHTKRLFKKGDSDIMAGFGLFPTFIKDRTDQVLPPVSLRYENRISNNFSMSLELGHSISNTVKKDVFSDEREYRNEYYFLALRNSAHCNCENFSNWDIYGGFALGLNLTNITVINGTFGPSEKLYGISPKNTQMTFNGFVGARYVCTKKLSFFGEFGYGASLLQLGMGYKL